LGAGTEILFLLTLGVLILGPTRLVAVARRLAKIKTDFEKASNGFKSQLVSELEGTPEDHASNGDPALLLSADNANPDHRDDPQRV
jgi:Sec-independent protein translocase protein TatA